VLRLPARVELPRRRAAGRRGELVGRGGSAILAPDGSYLAGPLWDEKGVLYAELDRDLLFAERQRFDAAGHYHRPDVLGFELRPPR